MFNSRIFFIAVAIFFLANGISKADSVGVSVDQSVFAFSIAPGATQDVTINVHSLSSSTQKMSVETEDFVVGDNNSITQLTDNNPQFGMKNWVSADQNDWFLDGGQNQAIKLTVSVPSDASVGAHYAIANIKALPQIDGQNFQQTIVGGQVGVYLLLNVKGAANGSGNLSKFSAPIIANKNASLKADFQNTGNILYIPHGEIQMQNLLTRKQTTIETEKHFVFPGKDFSFEMNWPLDSVFGIYKAQASFVDANGQVHTAERILMGRLFFLIPLLLIFIILLIYKIRRKTLRPRKQNQQQLQGLVTPMPAKKPRKII